MNAKQPDGIVESMDAKWSRSYRLTRPELLPQHIGDFKTEAEAPAWIGVKSAAWLVRCGMS